MLEVNEPHQSAETVTTSHPAAALLGPPTINSPIWLLDLMAYTRRPEVLEPVTSQVTTAPGGGSRSQTSSDGPILSISALLIRHDATWPDGHILRHTETVSV